MNRALVLAGALVLLGCQGKVRGHPSEDPKRPDQHTRRDLDLSGEQEAFLAELAATADAQPNNFDALARSGLAHMDFTLAGVLRLRDRAEQDLEAAFALNPNDPLLNRSLGRFYNLRAVAGDDSKAQMQVRVYAALLGDADPATMDDASFVAYSFFMLGRILSEKTNGNKLAALRKVGQLEAELAARVQAQPDNIELRALAGNFAFFFAGNIPLDRQRRVADAVAYFEVLRARWADLRAGAKDPTHCPNTWENFMFELAEGYMVLERGADARVIYAELAVIREPRTRAKELIAHVAAERLRNFDAYVGEMRLMPPWPSDVSNCVVCHAWSSDVGLGSLYSVEDVRLSDVPSQAQYKPILGSLAPGRAGGEIAGRQRLPDAVAGLIERECSPCHFEAGEVAELLDLSDADAIERSAALIEARVSAGEMPPDRGLSGDDRAVIRAWATGLMND
ncbi:hypothetical protein [Enhygromyxa salina]|uniref:Cytochrome c domain-containing protein n=1 Tax=Enhygromyxa salina TaxID=215803 RepID=A0A2S9XKY5_9BACT|nr:hypothetical protein [Enhygromyxa salina]PRP93525.1 hypothetical protein ENSA7_79530 [Enhygromyxa salina]